MSWLKVYLKNDGYEIKDAIGDMVVVLNKSSCVLEGMQIENCIDSAYDEIAKAVRAKWTNGTFVKQTL